MGRGIGLIMLAALLALAVGYYDYITPATGIDGTEGVMLVLGSSGLLLVGALAAGVLGRGVLVSILLFLVLLDIVGTGVAGYFLESNLLMGTMLLALIGWLLRVTARRKETV